MYFFCCIIHGAAEHIQEAAVLHSACKFIRLVIQPFPVFIFQIINICDPDIDEIIGDGNADTGDLLQLLYLLFLSSAAPGI